LAQNEDEMVPISANDTKVVLVKIFNVQIELTMLSGHGLLSIDGQSLSDRITGLKLLVWTV